jgi:trehalose 6-phosphate synthase/phosphatase
MSSSARRVSNHFLSMTINSFGALTDTLALWPLFHYLLWLDTTATVPAPDPSWAAYLKTNKLFAAKVAEIYQPGDLIIVHDYHLLLAPKMIRDTLTQQQSQNGNGNGSTPSPEKENDTTGEKTPDAGPMQKLGGLLNGAASKIGLAHRDTHQVNEIMIGMFMHTPWPSSEIFRCLPSKPFFGSTFALSRQY